MARRPPRPPKRRRTPAIEHPLVKDVDRCYFCGHALAPSDRVRRFHELTVHETCYQRDAER
jgi:hypothetical protein